MRPDALEDEERDLMTERGTSPGQRLTEMVEQMVVKNGVTRPVSVDDQLSDVGLTSLDMANLMLALEAEFDVTIPSGEITAPNFRSISSIEALILKLRPGNLVL